jgi:hypothetical protein
MKLPKLNLPVYELILPLSKIKVKYRPFTVKEQKILLMAIENKDTQFTLNNIKQIIESCTLTEVNIDELSIVDIEYFFIQLRARSVGETVDLNYRCKNINEEGKECNNLMGIELNLLDIKVKESQYSDLIELQPNIGIKMKFPSANSQKNLKFEGNATEILFDFIIECIDYIYDENTVYKAKEISKEELKQFIETFSIQQFEKINEYFKNLPKLQHSVHMKCKKCGTEHNIVIEGLENFLG